MAALEAPRADKVERAAGEPLDRSSAELLARTLRTVADPTRLQLLSLIHAAPRHEGRVTDLAEVLGLRQPTVSHHLRIMTEDGLLIREQRGREAWFSIASDRSSSIIDLLQ